jgi:hypothetical protein
MKKLIFPLVFLALGYGIFFFLFNNKKPSKISQKTKTSTPYVRGGIPSYSKVSEKESVRPEEKEEEERADFNPIKAKSETPPPSAERKYIGPDFKPIEQPTGSIVYENKYNPNWEDLLIKEFFDGDRPDGNIEIRRLDSFVYIKGGNGLYVEKVAVNVTAPKEMAGTFYAYVNSGTGEILHAWEGEEETPPTEVSEVSPESSSEDIENTAMDIPESTIEEGIEFTEEDMGTIPSEDTFYPDYN